MYKKRKKLDVNRSIFKYFNLNFSSKKGQVTLFIILGVLLLLALLLVIFVKKEMISFNIGDIVPTEKGKVESLIISCLEEVGNDALFTIGLQGGYIDIAPEIINNNDLHLRISPMHVVPYWAQKNLINIPSLDEIKIEMDQYIEKNVRECLFAGEPFQEEYDISERSDLTSDTEIVDNKVLFNLNWNVEIRTKGGEVVTEVINHIGESPVKLKKIHEVATRIIEKEMETLKLEDLTQDLISLDHLDVPLAGMEISCSKRTWEVNEVKKTLLEMIRLNLRELKVEGTDYVEFPKELTYYQNHYTWNVGEEFDYPEIGIIFNFDSSYPYSFGVTPLAGTKMRSSQLGGSDLLSFLCIQIWKFTYDLIYPVLVKIKDETTGYNFNIALTVHLIRNLPDRSEIVARPSYFLGSDTNDDYCGIRDIPMTVQTYELVENEETGVYNREPLENVDTSYTCLRYRCEMGTTEYGFTGLGDVAAYTMNFPYCASGILRGEKKGYKEHWKRVATTAGETVELNLMPTYQLPLNKIKVVKHEFTDLNNVGSAKELDNGEIVLLKLTSHKKNDPVNLPFHEVTTTISKTTDEEVLGEETIEFLAKADFGYEVEITVLEEESFVGGYKGKWVVPWDQLVSADEITFHVVSREKANENEMFELMLGLDQFSTAVPIPEIK